MIEHPHPLKWLKRFVFAIFLFGLISQVNADENTWRTGHSLFGEPKYSQDFQHYDHANPQAPKGGSLNLASFGGYDSFNPFVIRGRPSAGLNYQGGYLYDALFAHSIDQASTSYALISDGFRAADDYSWVVYRLHSKAKWHDGKPITAQDVVWSQKVLRDNHPLWKDYYKNIERVEITGKREISFFFDQKGNRELPTIIGDLPVLPKHWWTGKNAKGELRDIARPVSEPPLGSGPYKISKFDMGKSITWERVKDYWAKDLPLQKGRFNFDKIRHTYFLDATAMWEAFKKGGIADLRVERRSQRWANGYNFPAFKNGDVIKKAFEKNGPQFYQAFYFNTRKEKLQDHRVRQALFLMFNFEVMNKNLFFNSYTRTDSFFEGGELQSTGIPTGRELEILQDYRDKLPAALFTTAFAMPDYSKKNAFRKAQRKAIGLFKKAGYRFEKGVMKNARGEVFTLEFIGNNPTDERITNPLIENLRKIGVKANLRILDTAQYKNRLDKFDYEVTSQVTAQSLSPGNEQREYWSAEAATRSGSRNYSGINDPVIDELVERIIVAPNREELVHLTHALDRILKWQYFTIPMWHNPFDWIAYWRKFQFTENQPLYTGYDIYSFWVNSDVERELGHSN